MVNVEGKIRTAAVAMTLVLALPIILAGHKVGTFQIHGHVCGVKNTSLEGIEVSVQGPHGVVGRAQTDSDGLYFLDEIQLGSYTMLVHQPDRFTYNDYHRPLFQVDRTTTLKIDVVLRPAHMDCNVTADQASDPDIRTCGGADSFPLPSKRDSPFELTIQYFGRTPDNGGFFYEAEPQIGEPVTVAYNQFSLQATTASYDKKTRVLTATGKVVATNGDQTLFTGDKAVFQLSDGAVRVLSVSSEGNQEQH